MYDIYEIENKQIRAKESNVSAERVLEVTQLDPDNIAWAIEEYGFEATDDYIVTAHNQPEKAKAGLAVVLNADSSEQSDPDS